MINIWVISLDGLTPVGELSIVCRIRILFIYSDVTDTERIQIVQKLVNINVNQREKHVLGVTYIQKYV